MNSIFPKKQQTSSKLVERRMKQNREALHQYEYDNDSEHVIHYFSNNQMGLHLQTENAHISKQINKITRHEFVWTK
jgi:hypothetical protein